MLCFRRAMHPAWGQFHSRLTFWLDNPLKGEIVLHMLFRAIGLNYYTPGDNASVFSFTVPSTVLFQSPMNQNYDTIVDFLGNLQLIFGDSPF